MTEVTRSAAVIAAHTYAKRSCFEIGKRLEI